MGTWKTWFQARRNALRGLLVVFLMTWLHSKVSNNLTLWGVIFRDDGVVGNLSYLSILASAEELLLSLATVPMVIGVLLNHRWLIRSGFGLVLGLLTLSICSSIGQIILTILHRQGNRGATDLIWDASLIWLLQWGVFALGYWLLDSGVSEQRAADDLVNADFLFPQQQQREEQIWTNWQPQIVDYLFVSFCAGLTYGPTDTQVLSRRAKVLKMIQAMGSFILITVVMARAIGLLTN